MCFTMAGPALAQSSLPTEAFFQNSAFSNATLSPDGRNIAMTVAAKGGHVMLAVMDVETRATRVLVNVNSDVGAFRWVNDRRLAFSMQDRDIAVGENYGGGGIFAINIDGTEPRELATRKKPGDGDVVKFVKDVMPWHTRILPDVGKQDSDVIYVFQALRFREEGVTIALFRLDTRTGKSEVVKRVAVGKTVGWMLDQNGEPRISMVREGARSQMHYLDPATNEWRKLAQTDASEAAGLTPFRFGPDGTFYVVSRQGKDKTALYTYDLKQNALNPKAVVALADYDFNGALVTRNEHLAGFRYLVDAPGTLWLDEEAKAIQAAVDKQLPATNNQLSFARRATTPVILVHASSDAQPMQTWLYNTESGKLDLLGETRPDIDARRMARVAMVRYKARDGLDIPAYITQPAGGVRKNLPLVVLVHGGPWARGGRGGWEPQAQFLASRGYAVLEPEFRGSSGFGLKHLRAGFKQWGLKMQDDVADGAKWAIAQGIADPQRICIAGASYGGYAALMGLIKDADIFKCGISWAGVTDINLMYSVQWSDIDDVSKRYSMPIMIGDQDQDAAQLKATSPLENAARLKQPLLLAYGGSDRRVPLVHGTKFRDAVKQTNPDVEWVEYPEEGHGWTLLATSVDFWNRVEKFLNKNIGR
jgi:dipeptidyl aminopeptidase/acylaminoacyl peptidase